MAARLAGYEVTSTEGLRGGYASGYTFEANPSPGSSRHSSQISAPDDVATDRRLAPRYSLRLPVRATSQADEPWEHGTSVDASLTGLCVEMSRRPDPGYVDVEIDADVTIAAWARLVAWTPLEDGRFRWRLRLVSYDAGYPALLDGLDPIATGFAPRPADPEPAPRDDDDLVGVDSGWGPLLDSTTAF
ncbi:MAG: hypothetical protein ACRDZU_13700 [Acidimicrobiales bacterium]